MLNNDKRLAEWAVNLIETEYSNDVCLLLEHRSLKLEKDANMKAFSFYIPATSRANGLARTFIIGGVGYDLFPRSWAQIESMADVKDYNTTCLANAEILWARSNADKQRFVSLQARLRANLQNPQLMFERANKWFDYAKDIFQDTLFEEKLYKVRENAGHICDLLSIAVAFVNLRFFEHGQTNQIKELEQMENIPFGFVELYKKIIMEPLPDAQKKLCREIIICTDNFLKEWNKNTAPECDPDFTELAEWYQELIYTWRRIYFWCDENDFINAYMWCCMLQNEVDQWGAKFGIVDKDILGWFDANDLVNFSKRVKEVEQNFIDAIEKNGVKIEAYKTLIDFFAKYEYL